MSDNEKINKLASQLSKKMNVPKDQLISAIQSGNFDNVLKNMSASDNEKIRNLLGDEESAKKILATPQAQAIIKKLMG